MVEEEQALTEFKEMLELGSWSWEVEAEEVGVEEAEAVEVGAGEVGSVGRGIKV